MEKRKPSCSVSGDVTRCSHYGKQHGGSSENWITVWSSDSTLRHQSVQFSRSLVSNSLWPHGLQHARPPCPSPTAGGYSNSCPLSRWCHPAIPFSVIPFSSHLQSFPASESFPILHISSSHQVAKVLEFQLQHQSFWWICRTDFL